MERTQNSRWRDNFGARAPETLSADEPARASLGPSRDVHPALLVAEMRCRGPGSGQPTSVRLECLPRMHALTARLVACRHCACAPHSCRDNTCPNCSDCLAAMWPSSVCPKSARQPETRCDTNTCSTCRLVVSGKLMDTNLALALHGHARAWELELHVDSGNPPNAEIRDVWNPAEDPIQIVPPTPLR